MKTKFFRIAAAASLTLFTALSYAQEDKNYTFYYFTQKNSSVHEQVSCLVTNANDYDLITGRDRYEMVTGFTKGSISIPVSEINSVYFDGYFVPNTYDRYGIIYLIDKNNTYANIQCYPGTSAPGDKAPRTLMAGPYGFPDQEYN